MIFKPLCPWIIFSEEQEHSTGKGSKGSKNKDVSGTDRDDKKIKPEEVENISIDLGNWIIELNSLLQLIDSLHSTLWCPNIKCCIHFALTVSDKQSIFQYWKLLFQNVRLTLNTQNFVYFDSLTLKLNTLDGRL